MPGTLVKQTNKLPSIATEQISELTTNRLSVYLRCLELLSDAGRKTTSSGDLASQFRLNAAQIRKDLACFGEFGVRGVGYYVEELKRHLREILGIDRTIKVVIMGAGNLGLALAGYPGFRREGFDVVALFDNTPQKIGTATKTGIPIHDVRRLPTITSRQKVGIAVLAVPAASAQSVANRVVKAGIKAVLNFSPEAIQVPPDVKLKSVDLTVSLESLSFHLARGEGGRGGEDRPR